MAFAKCGTKEAGKLCGRYPTGANTAHICQYCTCPVDGADGHTANFPCKTEVQTKELVPKANTKEDSRKRQRKLSKHSNKFPNTPLVAPHMGSDLANRTKEESTEHAHLSCCMPPCWEPLSACRNVFLPK